MNDKEERVYRVLLRNPAATLDQLALAAGVGRGQLRKVLTALEIRGLVSRSTQRSPAYIPVAPDVGIEGLIQRRQEELESARGYAAQLLEEYRISGDGGNPVDFVEVVSGREAVARRFMQLQLMAADRVLIFDKPPYAQPINDYGSERLRQGIRYRTIYSQESLSLPGRVEMVRQDVRAGEVARLSPELPMKLAIADRRLAIMPLNLNVPTEVGSAIVVHQSSLLDALVTLFETFWARAVPLSFSAEVGKHAARDGRDGEDEVLLTLLAAGLTDEAIAHQMGISVRTVRRRIRRLIDELGVVTRFQAGLQAARRGWLTDTAAEGRGGRSP